MRRRITAVAIAAAAAVALLAACTDDKVGEGLPDLDQVHLDVGATVEVGPSGCDPAEVSAPAGDLIRFVARAPQVRIESPDADAALVPIAIDRGDASDVRRSVPTELEVVCSAGDGKGPVRERNRALLRWVGDR